MSEALDFCMPDTQADWTRSPQVWRAPVRSRSRTLSMRVCGCDSFEYRESPDFALGVANPTVQRVGGTAGGTLMTVGTAILPANPLVGGIIIGAGAVIGLFSSFFGGGCGQVCIDAAKREQVYEATADNILFVAQAGMISGAAAAQAIRALIQAGTQAEGQLGTKQGQKGAINLTKVVGQSASEASALGPAKVPFSLSAAEALYLNVSNEGTRTGAKWYPDALAAAAQLTDQVLPQIAGSDSGSLASSLSAITSGRVAGIPIWILLVAGGVAFLALRK